jgi:hypothetical protein
MNIINAAIPENIVVIMPVKKNALKNFSFSSIFLIIK